MKYKAKRSFVSRFGSATKGETVELGKDAAKKLKAMQLIEEIQNEDNQNEETATGDLK